MMRMRLKLQSKEPMVIALVLFISSIIVGILCSKIGSSLLLSGIAKIDETYFVKIKSMDILYGDLFWFTFINHLKEFFLFWLLCITILGIPYIGWKIIAGGFQVGFLLCALCMQYNLKGILLAFAYVFPQVILYVPILLYCLRYGYELAKDINNANCHSFVQSITMLLNYRKLIIILIGAILIGSFLETFVGTFFIRKVLAFF